MICKQLNKCESKYSFLFVCATERDSIDEIPFVKCLSLMNLKHNINVLVFNNNSKGLSEVYNYAIENNSKGNTFTIFLHDDIWINDVLIFDKLIDSYEKGDVIGICGGKKWNRYGNGKQPIIWTNAAEGRMSGFIVHSADAKQDTKTHDMLYNNRSLFATNYGGSPSQVLTIDGCFICFTDKAVNKGLRFDESFKFHFYDMDVSFSAFVRKLKVVTSPILLTHESLGYSVMQETFLEAQKKFVSKWFTEK